jgi:endonuclease YncB( thermonuclease family)
MTASDWPTYRWRAKMIRVKDGDTAVLQFDTGFNQSITLPIRLVGYNAPELRGPDPAAGAAARASLAALLADATLYVETIKDSRSFERYLACVFVERGGVLTDVAESMKALGYDVTQGQ